MKKNYFTMVLFSFIFTLPLPAQVYENDPLEDGYIIRNGGANEIITTDNFGVSVLKYYKEMELAPWDTVVSVLYYGADWADGIYDMTTADVDGDSLDEIIKVWINNDQVEIAVLKPDPALLSIDSLADWQKIVRLHKSDPAPYSLDWFLPEAVLVEAGNFDADEQMEFVVSYWAQVGGDVKHVNLTVYDADDTLAVTEKGSIADLPLEIPPVIELCEDRMHLFDIECGDFNGDGIDEIILGARQQADPDGWQFITRVYSYDSVSGDLTAKVDKSIYIQDNSIYDVANLNLAAGYLTAADKEQIVAGFYQYNPEARGSHPDTAFVTLIALEVNDMLTDITTGPAVEQHRDTIDIDIDCMYDRLSTLTTEDVNHDGIDEIVSAFTVSEYSYPAFKTLKIYQMSAGLNLSEWADLSDMVENYHADVAIGDIRRETSEEKYSEVIVKGYDKAYMYQLKYTGGGAFEEYVFIDDFSDGLLGYGKSEPLRLAQCDGDIRLGSPNRFSATEILQPLVILNAPPIHFDVFNDQIYDVSKSYNENEPQFISSYYKESSELTELQTEVNRDWALSASVSAGVSFWGVSVSSHFSQTWGEKFSKVDATTTKVTVSINVDAIEDDRIYAIVMDYDIWEYPIYLNDNLKGHALVVEPRPAEHRWFPSKSWSGHDYIPEHEVSNILSYREYPMLSNNPMLDEKIKGDYTNSFVLDENSSYNWELQFDDFSSSSASTTKEYSRDWGASVSGWGCGFSIDGHYSSEDINTQRTEVATGLNLGVHLDGIDMGIGEVGYIVTPYAYWAKNGALVIDYAVKPELSKPGGTPTWWQVYYEDYADPAFILPWRYDPEKGFTLEDDAKRQQTKDLQFFPENPLEGDDVTIKARIHNFSLIATPGPIGVRFYLGNPDEDGVLLENTGGENEVFTAQAIEARGTEVVEFTWTVSGEVGEFPRIYAIIDADSNLTEIHENNNKSWAILNKTSGTAIRDQGDDMLPEAFNLAQNFPNPFNNTTTIRYQLPDAGMVSLQVFNLLGQKVADLVSEKQIAGSHQISVDISDLSSGIYIYRLRAGAFTDTKKMVLLK
ncbi:MAG: T9SS type A sorting domain-containing protein [Calditrichaceae bacterium]|nr:T9SS type A sorting domain-containing protein [Calditrichaceae bacterium]